MVLLRDLFYIIPYSSSVKVILKTPDYTTLLIQEKLTNVAAFFKDTSDQYEVLSIQSSEEYQDELIVMIASIMEEK